MPITLGNTLSLDDLTSGVPALTAVHSQQLGADKIVSMWYDSSLKEARFSVHSVDGTTLIAARSVDAATAPDVALSLQTAFAARENADGTITVHFTMDEETLFPLAATHYTRSFSADGTPTGPSQEVSGVEAYFQPENSVAIQTSGNKIAIAHDGGFTVLNADGTIAGGSVTSPGFRSTDNGYDVAEAADGRLLVVSTDNRIDFSTFQYAGPITAQFYKADGTADGDPFDVAPRTNFSLERLGSQSIVSVDILTDERIVVAYSDANAEAMGETGITVKIFNPDGTQIGDSFLGNPDGTAESQYFPQVNALDTGGFVVSYETNDVVNGSVSPLFRLQEFSSDGKPAGASVFRGPDPSAAVTGQIYTVILPDGRGMVIDETGGAVLVDIDGVTAPVDPLAGPDTITGTVEAETLDGGAGDDKLTGLAGADTLLGGTGDDLIYGDSFSLSASPFPIPTETGSDIYRLYRATLDREPDAGGLLGWTQQLYEGSSTVREIANGFILSKEFQNTYGALEDGAFVDLLYQNVLGRAADAAGRAGWLEQIAGGTERRDVVLGFSQSAEFKQETLAAAGEFQSPLYLGDVQDDIYRIYRATLDRDPDLAGFTGWMDALQSGSTVLDAVGGFVNSAEFQATYGALDDAAFVGLLYQNVLNRAADAAGQAGWLDAIANGSTREDVVLGFSNSREFQLGTEADLEAWMRSIGVDDRIEGGAGTNTLVGGILADTFVFDAADQGTHRILDLEEWDTLEFVGFGFTSTDDIFSHFVQSTSSNGLIEGFSYLGTTIEFDDRALFDSGSDMLSLG
ncbi:DUF4214 domain-containing protein [uncultured Sulfitobacter sp.]|uniref:DUF4214 domain-containing protein n=1 Tax=uncultured Sulfitobacter sp. TaxID=191468 RepID=UPI00260CF8D4|nr:DUF4214 domain-containing protein [uncultured Sulfitobacter sp.]